MLRIVMGLVIGMLGCEDAQRAETGLEDSRAKLAKVAVDKIANDDFVRWSMSNADKACPADLADLAKVAGQPALEYSRDPWGTPYKMQCGTLPPGARGIAISSAGPDKRHETADDLASWKR